MSDKDNFRFAVQTVKKAEVMGLFILMADSEVLHWMPNSIFHVNIVASHVKLSHAVNEKKS